MSDPEDRSPDSTDAAFSVPDGTLELFRDPGTGEPIVVDEAVAASATMAESETGPESDIESASEPTVFVRPSSPATQGFERPFSRRVVVVGGAKGGVGKTVFAANLAVYLATIGRRVVLVDADASGANAHTLLGLPHQGSRDKPRGNEGGRDEGRDSLRETSISGLRWLTAHLDEPMGGSARAARRKKLADYVRAIDTDYVIVDLGSGTDHALVDLYLEGDLSVFLTLPEPTSIESTYRFFRCAFSRYVRRSLSDRGERSRLRHALARFDGAPSPPALLAYFEAQNDSLAAVVRDAIETFSPQLVLNQARARADLELGDAMRSALRSRFGIAINYLGYIDYDDTVLNCVRIQRPLLVESPGTKASKNIEKLARRLLALDAGKLPRPAFRSVPSGTHHELLEVNRGATDEEVRRAYKRMREVYGADSLACYGLFDQGERDTLRARLEEAHDVLLDPLRRRPYEMSVFPDSTSEVDEEPGRTLPPELRPKAPNITPETEFSGALLRAVRESQGVDLRDISQHTKIGSAYLAAIEDEDVRALPALVYVRGFVAELAKFLKLDPVHVSRTYMRRFKRTFDLRQQL